MKVMFKLPKGKWDSLEVQNRAELMELREGILKKAVIRIPDGEQEQPNTRLYSRPMQNICGY